jgi:Tfp pilus assembly protein PilF
VPNIFVALCAKKIYHTTYLLPTEMLALILQGRAEAWFIPERATSGAAKNNLNQRLEEKMTDLSPKYNPAFLKDAELLALFVVRKAYLETILKALGENSSGRRHILLIGPRGIGKTTLVRRVALETRQDESLNREWYSIAFSEESYEISTPGEFWLEALRRLAEQVGSDELRGTCSDLENESNEGRLRDRALDSLRAFSKKERKRLLVIVENLNMLIDEQFDQVGTSDLWRTLLKEGTRITLLATCLNQFTAGDRDGDAFVKLLTPITLDPLSAAECSDLFLAITGRNLQSGQARAIQILTGGNPRLVRILAEFSNKRSFRDLLSDLVHLVDDHTEYFKSQIDALPAVERKVFVALLAFWQPVTAHEVAKTARLPVSKTSALLNRLVSRGAVSVVNSGSPKKLYHASERLYNIYYLLRKHGHPSTRVRAAVRFMTHFYRNDELIQSTADLAREACSLDSNSRAELFTAYREIVNDPFVANCRFAIIRATPKEFFSFPEAPDDIRQMATGAPRLHAHSDRSVPKEVKALLTEGQGLQLKGETAKAEVLFRKAIQLAPTYGHSMAHLGFLLYSDLKSYQEAKELLERATSLNPLDSWAWLHMGRLLIRMGDDQGGTVALLKCTEIDPKEGRAWLNLGFCFHDLGRYQECENALRKAIENGDPSEKARAWGRLAELFHYHLHQPEEARNAYQIAIANSEVQDGWTFANYAEFLASEAGDSAEAERQLIKAKDYFEAAVQKDSNNAEAWGMLGRIYSKGPSGKRQAETALRKATEIDPNDSSAWEGLAEFLWSAGRWEEAEISLRSALRAKPGQYDVWTNLGWVLSQQGQVDKAQSAYEKAIELNPDSSPTLTAYGELLLQSGQTEKALELLRRSTSLDGWHSPAWPTLIAVQAMQGGPAVTNLVETAQSYLNANNRNPEMLNSMARKIVKTNSTELRNLAEILAKEAFEARRDWSYVDTVCTVLSAQGRWGDVLEWIPLLFDVAGDKEEVIESAIRFAITASAAGYAERVLTLLTASRGFRALEPLEAGVKKFMGRSSVVPREIDEIATDIAASIRRLRQLVN